MKIVIVGGHLGPALAVIEALPKADEVLFLGRKFALEGDNALSLEYKTINARKIKFFPITSGRLQRKFTKHTLFSILKFPYGFLQSLFILGKTKPDVVVGFGGYLSLPVSLAAFLLKIPVVIHEQTLEAGLANRIISFFTQKICISWESSRRYFPKEKTVLTGNPIRQFKISNFKFQIKDDSPVVYVTGGSLGSHFLNVLIESCLEKILEKVTLVQQTGDAQEFLDFDRLSKKRASLKSELQARYILAKFIDPSAVGSVLQKADLVISRCGINTITELINFQKIALLIPLPFSQGNEQIKNALFLKSKGVAEILFQKDAKNFLPLLMRMFSNFQKYKKNLPNLENLVKKDASSKIAEVIRICSKKPEKTSTTE